MKDSQFIMIKNESTVPGEKGQNEVRLCGKIQYEKCTVTGMELGLNDWYCRHKNPYHLSKDNRFSNLVVLHETVH